MVFPPSWNRLGLYRAFIGNAILGTAKIARRMRVFLAGKPKRTLWRIYFIYIFRLSSTLIFKRWFSLSLDYFF